VTLPAIPGSPPSDLEAEVSVLGAMLLDNGVIAEVRALVRPGDFYRESHRKIFEAILALVDAGSGVDAILVREELRRRGDLATVGGADAIVTLLERAPTAANASRYAGIIGDASLRRRLVAAAEAAADGARNGSTGAEALAAIRQRLDGIEAGAASEALPFQTARALSAAAGDGPRWIVHGLLAVGGITELAAKIKVGKTTWAAYLLASVLEGRPFLGLQTVRSPVIYLTEERGPTFREALADAGLLGAENLHVLSKFDALKIPWPRLVDGAIQKARSVGAKVIVADTVGALAGLSGEEENHSGAALAAMLPLGVAAAAEIAVLALRHERKSGGELGDSARGSSAFGGSCDILLSLRRANTQGHPNRRSLLGIGRFREVPELLVMELRDGEYVTLGDGVAVERSDARAAILDRLPGPDGPLITEAEVLALLPAGTSRGSCQRALRDLVKAGKVAREKGAGKSGRAFGYRLTANQQISIGKDPDHNSSGLKSPSGEIRGMGADHNCCDQAPSLKADHKSSPLRQVAVVSAGSAGPAPPPGPPRPAPRLPRWTPGGRLLEGEAP